MSTIIQIKRNSGTTAPGTSDLVVGEMAYAYDASNDGASAKLYIEAVNSSSAADIHVIGGKYFTDLLDHTAGTLTAGSALIVDSNSKIDVLNVDNTTINGNDISSTDSNGNLTLTPNGTGMVVINKTDGFQVPVGTTAQRRGSPATGQLRYNSTTSQFEGYAASSWGSLGGVIDVDQDTKITAESAAGQDEDVLTFFTAGTAQVVIADGALRPVTDNDVDLGTSSLEFKDAFFDGTVTSDAFAGPLTGDVTGTIQTAAQPNITSLGTLTALTVDDVNINGKVITMTGSTSDTATLTVGTNGTLDITTTDDNAAAANITITADGTFEAIGSTITLDSGGAINLEPASGSAILLDGTISVDAGVVTGATSITSTAFVGTLSTAAQANVTSLGTLTILNVDNLRADGNIISSTDSNGDINLNPNGTGNVVVGSDSLIISAAEGESSTLMLRTDEGDDNGDDWTVVNATGNTLTFNSDISGSSVAQITLTPHATVASSTTAIAGALTVAGVTTFSGAVDMGSQATTNVNVDSGAIDGVTIGTNSAVTDLRVDNIKVDGNTVSSTDSNGNVILAPNGSGDVVANTDQLQISATEGEAATLLLQTDEGDDNGDDWTISNSTSNVLSFNNDASGSAVSHFQITPNSTVASSTAAFPGHVTIAGNLTITGATTTTSSTNTTIADKLVELATGSSGSASGDVGHVIERGDDDNVFIGWDESIDALVVGTGSFTGSTTGDLSHTLAAAKFGSLTLSTDLAVAEGGTGVSTFTDNGILYGDGSNALDVTAAPGSSPETTSNQILTANGSGVPKWTTTIDGGTY
ncbi:hypothetical protein [uncultured Mediterranean phage]|nr:hypothetical protein [uncultured Mediterranean phage]